MYPVELSASISDAKTVDPDSCLVADARPRYRENREKKLIQQRLMEKNENTQATEINERREYIALHVF